MVPTSRVSMEALQGVFAQARIEPSVVFIMKSSLPQWTAAGLTSILENVHVLLPTGGQLYMWIPPKLVGTAVDFMTQHSHFSRDVSLVTCFKVNHVRCIFPVYFLV